MALHPDSRSRVLGPVPRRIESCKGTVPGIQVRGSCTRYLNKLGVFSRFHARHGLADQPVMFPTLVYKYMNKKGEWLLALTTRRHSRLVRAEEWGEHMHAVDIGICYVGSTC